jgi:polyhydroxyalkanoate synthesis regulator phasin
MSAGRRASVKLPFLAALAIVTCAGIEVHADEWPTPPQQAIDTSLERRIENALRDLEIFNARALKVDAQAKDGTLERRIEDSLKDLESATTRTLKADEERLNALARQITGVSR